MAVKEGYTLLAVRVPVALHTRLKLEAVRRGISLASLAETALRQFLSGKRAHR